MHAYAGGAMSHKLVAIATTTIKASRRQVWDALVSPAAIKQYMFGADVHSQWTSGSKITWTGEMQGNKYEDKGVILNLVPEQTLRYTHFSPTSGKPDEAENYHTVCIELSGSGRETKVTLSQNNNANENARAESEANWGTMLKGLKQYVEQAP